MGVPSNERQRTNPGFRWTNSSPGPWRGIPLRVIRCGNQEGRHRPPSKLAHGSAARENAEADGLRGLTRRKRVRSTEYAPFGVRLVRGVGVLHGRKGRSCI
jgi:hypothetical protein